ncbi:MAG TPA: hypothetical protein ENI29_23295, partial [bacterium]|nr:hypothetical protein [bacterium]
MKRSSWGIFLLVIGLLFLGYHMIQYIELIERINLLLALFGSSIDTKGIIMEVSVGFLITVAGFM